MHCLPIFLWSKIMFALKIPAFHLLVSIFFANIVFMFHASSVKDYCMMESLNLIYRKSCFQPNGCFISFVTNVN